MPRFTMAVAVLGVALATACAHAAGLVVTGEVRGGIGPASAAYVERLLATAAEREADLVVLALDTPGGLDTSMREMIQAILGSPVPVAIYVSPRGARAASAGTYLLYAAHLAAMAPGTNVGAATPVAIGIGGGDDERGRKPSPRDPAADRSDGPRPDEGAAARDPSRQKAVRDAVAYLQGLADLRGRNAEWARKSVVDADSLPAREALKQGVVDIVAVDLADLLRQADGRSVEAGTSTRVLAVAGASVEAVAANWKERLLAAISNPNLALLLLMAGLYGLLIEFYVPGTGVPGVIGAIALLLGLYGLALLPVTLAGAALLLLGIALMVAEGFAPSFGALGIGGVFALAAGGVLLLDDVPG
ncbi:MAG: nodulation protein NfeD, partial [Burkholderiales bacterium]|nr:nodulation protein NfeD [Burkholderiales bacterium]